VERTYLFVPPEEYSEAQALGARWDAGSKRWYIEAHEPFERFSMWLPNAQADEEFFSIDSTEGYVAAATTSCRRCRSSIEVICIHCESGNVSGDPLTQFTVSDVWAMDEVLAEQLRRWPTFYRAVDPDAGESYFANHCRHCGALQEDMYLHSEPNEPFFDIPRAPPGSIKLTPLVGTIKLSGNEHFVVE
jgi:Domain of unknown function (DUF5710)